LFFLNAAQKTTMGSQVTKKTTTIPNSLFHFNRKATTRGHEKAHSESFVDDQPVIFP